MLLLSRPSSGPLSWAARCHVSGWLALLLYFYLKPTSLLGRRAKGRSFPLGVQDVCRRHHGPLLTLSLNTTVFTRPPTRCGRLLLVVDLLSLVRWSDAGISPLPCSAPGFVACQPSAQPRRPWADGPALSGAGRSYYTPGSSLLQLRNLFLFRFCNTRGVAPFSVDPVVLGAFCVYEARWVSLPSLWLYLSGIRSASSDIGYPWLLDDNPLCARALRARLRRFGCPEKSLKVPLPFALLIRLFELLPGWPRAHACPTMTVSSFLLP